MPTCLMVDILLLKLHLHKLKTHYIQIMLDCDCPHLVVIAVDAWPIWKPDHLLGEGMRYTVTHP